MKLEEAEELTEDINLIKFFYERFKHDPYPKVLAPDPHYIYNGKGEVVKGQDDVLGYNLHYSSDKDSKQAIEEIYNFAKDMLDKGKQDIYIRIKEFYPSSLKYIRHYKRGSMHNIKVLNGKEWKKISSEDL